MVSFYALMRVNIFFFVLKNTQKRFYVGRFRLRLKKAIVIIFSFDYIIIVIKLLWLRFQSKKKFI